VIDSCTVIASSPVPAMAAIIAGGAMPSATATRLITPLNSPPSTMQAAMKSQPSV